MCGIAAVHTPYGSISDVALRRATDRLSHRGPDGRSMWVAPHGRIGLGHARLARTTLTGASSQSRVRTARSASSPMRSSTTMNALLASCRPPGLERRSVRAGRPGPNGGRAERRRAEQARDGHGHRELLPRTRGELSMPPPSARSSPPKPAARTQAISALPSPPACEQTSSTASRPSSSPPRRSRRSRSPPCSCCAKPRPAPAAPSPLRPT